MTPSWRERMDGLPAEAAKMDAPPAHDGGCDYELLVRAEALGRKEIRRVAAVLRKWFDYTAAGLTLASHSRLCAVWNSTRVHADSRFRHHLPPNGWAVCDAHVRWDRARGDADRRRGCNSAYRRGARCGAGSTRRCRPAPVVAASHGPPWRDLADKEQVWETRAARKTRQRTSNSR